MYRMKKLLELKHLMFQNAQIKFFQKTFLSSKAFISANGTKKCFLFPDAMKPSYITLTIFLFSIHVYYIKYMKLINQFAKLLLLILASCTPMQLLQELKSPYLQQLNFLKTIRDYHSRSLSLLKTQYQCITPIKQQNTKQRTEKQLLHTPMTTSPEAFHDLQLLEDLSAKHWTSVFWYEYRHKREVRQFDDEETKMNNAKKEMENIVMGNYQIKDDLAIVGADAEQMALVRKTAQLRKAQVQDVAFLVTDRHPDTGVITVNRPLFVGESSRFYRFKVHCSIQKITPVTNQTIIEHNSYIASPISPFQLSFSHQPYKCGKYINSIERMDKTSPKTLSTPELSLINSKLLSGSIEKVCNLNKPVTEGNVLILYIEQKKGNITVQKKQHFAVIEKVIGEDAYVVDTHVAGVKVIDDCVRVSEKDFGLSGDVQFPTLRYNDLKLFRGKFAGSHFLQFQGEVQLGEQLFCYTITKLFTTNIVLSSRVAVGEKLGHVHEVFHFGVDGENYQSLFQSDNLFTCTSIISQPSKKPQPNPSTFTTIHKLTAPATHTPSANTIHALTLSDDCIIQVTTKNPQVKYILTGTKMYKIEQLSNGTLIESSENPYYENMTSNSMIYLYEGLWRVDDLLMFPRLKVEADVTSFIVRFGYVYVRELFLDVLGHQTFSLSSRWMNQHLGYGPKRRPPHSLSTEKRFKGGQFCSEPINKDRQTLVKLRCGQSWFHIRKVQEISPCTYQLHISTQFLCANEQPLPTLGNSIIPFNGTICYPN